MINLLIDALFMIGREKMQNRVERAIKESGLGKSDVARLLGKSPTYISLVIKGELIPNLEDALKIASIVNKPIEELFQAHDNDMTPEPDSAKIMRKSPDCKKPKHPDNLRP